MRAPKTIQPFMSPVEILRFFLISKLGGGGAMAVVPLLYYIPLYKAQKHNVEWKRKVNSRQ